MKVGGGGQACDFLGEDAFFKRGYAYIHRRVKKNRLKAPLFFMFIFSLSCRVTLDYAMCASLLTYLASLLHGIVGKNGQEKYQIEHI